MSELVPFKLVNADLRRFHEVYDSGRSLVGFIEALVARTSAEHVAAAERALVERSVREVSTALASMASDPPRMLTDAGQRVWIAGVDAAAVVAIGTTRAALPARPDAARGEGQ